MSSSIAVLTTLLLHEASCATLEYWLDGQCSSVSAFWNNFVACKCAAQGKCRYGNLMSQYGSLHEEENILMENKIKDKAQREHRISKWHYCVIRWWPFTALFALKANQILSFNVYLNSVSICMKVLRCLYFMLDD